jgi:hypothetical protein
VDGVLLQRRGHAGAVAALVFDLADGLGLRPAACHRGSLALAQQRNSAEHFVIKIRQAAHGHACELVEEVLNVGAVEDQFMKVLGDGCISFCY